MLDSCNALRLIFSLTSLLSHVHVQLCARAEPASVSQWCAVVAVWPLSDTLERHTTRLWASVTRLDSRASTHATASAHTGAHSVPGAHSSSRTPFPAGERAAARRRRRPTRSGAHRMPSQREEVVAVGGAGCAAGARAPASKLIEDGMMPSHLLDRLVRSSTGRRRSAIGRTEDRSTTVRETVSRSFKSPIAAFGACQQVGGARQGGVGRRGRASTGGAARAWAVRTPPVWSHGAHLGSDAVPTCARALVRSCVRARAPRPDLTS